MIHLASRCERLLHRKKRSVRVWCHLLIRAPTPNNEWHKARLFFFFFELAAQIQLWQVGKSLFYFLKCQPRAEFTSARSPVALCIVKRPNKSECQLGGAIARLAARLQTTLLPCECGFPPWPPYALWHHSDSLSPQSRDRTAAPPSLRLNRRKTIRFWSVMLLLAVIGLELTGFTLVGNFITFKTFCFPTSSVTADT